MKHERALTGLTAAILGFVTAFGASGCLVSAFDLTLENPWSMLLVCALGSLICAAAFTFRYGGTAVLCLAALLCGYLYHDGREVEQLCQLVYRLSTIYSRAYGWKVLQLTETAWDAGFADWPVAMVGALIALTVSRSVCRRKSVWLPVLTTLIPLGACVVVTDTVPGELWLLLVLTGLILLILTSSVRRENALQGARLMAGAALPVVIGLLALFLAVPQNDYVNRTKELQEKAVQAAEKIPQLMENGMNDLASRFQKSPPAQVDLAGLGPRLSFTYTVMEVTAERSGTLYLRGQDYDYYDGLGWTATKTRQEVFSRWSGELEQVTIRTENRKELQFLPYYPAGETALTGGRVENPEKEQKYTVTRTELPEDWRVTAYQKTTARTEKWPQYCSLPENTRREASALLEGLFSADASHTEKADVIAALVMDGAVYDLDPAKMPDGETDFAIWFLREGESGYCVHFATSATVLLRAADVPARYVTGYMVEAEAGETVAVTEDDAHAWAEYYEPNLDCWIPLEATPGMEVPVEVLVTQPAVPETTEAEKTEPVPEETVPETTEPPSEPSSEHPTAAPDERSEETISRESPVKLPWWIRVLPVIQAALLVLLLAGLAAAQRSLRLHLRRRQQRTGSGKSQALHRWQETERLNRLLKTEPPEELLNLAQKAGFSQHDITPEELQRFDIHNRACQKQLREKPWYLRLVYQYIFAAF